MADPNHLTILEEGVEAWNDWRKAHPNIIPDLSTASLRFANLQNINLKKAQLQRADFLQADICGANFDEADILGATFELAEFKDASFIKTCLHDCFFKGAKGKNSKFGQAKMNYTNFEGADLEHASFGLAELQNAIFYSANLKDASFWMSNLKGANLYSASLQRANFDDADIEGGNLCSARCSEASFERTIFKGVSLSGADLTNTKVVGAIFDNKMKCRSVNVTNSHGSQRFLRHLKDQDYLEEFREEHPKVYKWWKLTSDCGRSWGRWAAWSSGLALLFAGILYACYFMPFLPDWLVPTMTPTIPQSNQNWFAPIYFSIVTFTTLGFGDITPANTAGQIFLTLEVIIGYVMLGGLISLISNKMGRRSG